MILNSRLWVKKDLLSGQKKNLFLQDQSGKFQVGKVAWALNLARSSNQSEHRIPFTLPTHGFGHIIKFFNICDSNILTCNPLGQEFKCHGQLRKFYAVVIKLLLLSVLLTMIVTVISCQDKVSFCLCSFT